MTWRFIHPCCASFGALLANSIATGAVLVPLIFTFGPISGAHFNPAVWLAAAFEGGFAWRRVPGYVAAQIVGAILGVFAAHLMFELPLVTLSRHTRVQRGAPAAQRSAITM